jgi:ribosomal protein S14
MEHIDYIYKPNSNHKHYKATCSSCGKDRGYVRKHYLKLLCLSCSLLQSPKVANRPGHKHINKERFRKNTFSNVDYEDSFTTYNKSGNKCTKYKQRCPKCNIDVGYRVHYDAQRTCKKCRDLERTKYTPEQKRIRCSMKANLVARLKARLDNKNKKSTFDILGYSVDELKVHLESSFKEGMSWDNYGEWEIDHITPDSWFQYNSTDDEGFKNSWALDNLQPLWKHENIAKGNRYRG